MKRVLSNDDQKNHLLVLIHGFAGSPKDFANFKNRVLKYDDEYVVLVIDNSGKTTDGVVNGAKRAAFQVKSTLEQNQNISKISVVGHSLGGIYARYLVYLLDQNGTLNKLEPCVFATFATPHLGVRKPLTNPLNLVFQNLILRIFQTTRELGMLDTQDGSTPLLHQMVDEDYIRPLKRFKRRVLYANISNDFQVPYTTASLRHRNPYRGNALQGNSNDSLVKVSAPMLFSKEYPNISKWSLDKTHERKTVETAGLLETGVLHPAPCGQNVDPISAAKSFRGDSEKERLRDMMFKLDVHVGSWERYDVKFASLLAHEQIIGKRSCLPGYGVLSHFVETVLTKQDAEEMDPIIKAVLANQGTAKMNSL